MVNVFDNVVVVFSQYIALERDIGGVEPNSPTPLRLREIYDQIMLLRRA